jgi:hypothetical protein
MNRFRQVIQLLSISLVSFREKVRQVLMQREAEQVASFHTISFDLYNTFFWPAGLDVTAFQLLPCRANRFAQKAGAQ